MSHYKSNVRDLEFNLVEVFNRQDVLGAGPYGEVDADTAREVLHEVARLAEGEIAASFTESDRTPPTFDPETHEATMPEAFSKSYKAWADAEFWRMNLEPELGGTLATPSVNWAIAEMILGANPAVFMFSAGFSFANILFNNGTDEQKQLAQLMIDRHWGATMVLTEPDAGSDVGAGVTKAVQQEDGTWHLTGVKRFITNGDADFYENNIHFVLARPEGAGPGTKGLSLFVVPKHHYDPQTGELGERNGAYVTNVEHKMGLKVSTTCELRFGEDPSTPAVGTLLGDVHDGIAQMFQVIEYARMLVGTKAIATLSTGYLNALEYAKERVQGPDMLQMGDKTAPRVTITHHPDVRRSLMLQKAYSEGLRALVQYTATFQDTAHAHRAETGQEPAADSPAGLAERINDLLLPVVKGVGSERAWVLLGTESLQTFGGSGFLQDYPLEQYVRDAKIDTLYEGTTAIQAQDFFFRKILRDQGTALGAVAQEIQEFLQAGGAEQLGEAREQLGKALVELQQFIGLLTGWAQAAQGEPRELYKVGLQSSRLLMAAGDVIIGWLLLRQAQVASEKVDAATGADQDFYTGKIAAATFFAREVLPRIGADRRAAESTTGELMELPESAF